MTSTHQTSARVGMECEVMMDDLWTRLRGAFGFHLV